MVRSHSSCPGSIGLVTSCHSFHMRGASKSPSFSCFVKISGKVAWDFIPLESFIPLYLAGKHASRQAGRQAKQAGRQAGRQAGKQAGRPNRQAGKHAGKQASKQAGRQAGRQAGKQEASARATSKLPRLY